MDRSFGGRLRATIRARLGPNQEREFARRIGMDPTQLSRILNGKVGKRPEHETLLRFARGLEMPVDTLVSWTLEDAGISPPLATPEDEPDADMLAEMVARVRATPGLMAQIAHLEEEVSPETYQEVIEAIADAWIANIRMGMRAARAGRGN